MTAAASTRRGILSPQMGEALGGALLLGLPLLALALVFDLTTGAALQRTLTLMLIYMIAVVGIGVFAGNSGILSFGHVAFVGIGAYVSSLLTLPLATKAMALPNLPPFLAELQMAFLPALLVTLAVVAVVALVVGLPICRMDGPSAVIGTLGILLIVHGVIVGAADFTRGSDAFLGVTRMTGLWIAAGAAFGAIVIARFFRDTVAGAKLRASREDELAAAASGVNIRRVRLTSWVLSAVLCGLSGVLLGHFLGAFSPTKFYFDDTLTLLTMLIVGGMATVSGAIFGTVLVTVVIEVLRRVEGGVDLFGFVTPEAFGLTQAGLCVMILLVMYKRAGGLVPRLEWDEILRLRFAHRSPRDDTANGLEGLAVTTDKELTAEGVTKKFDGLVALDKVDLNLATGEIVGLIGPNGSGKTTLLSVLSGSLLLSDGRIAVNGRVANGWSPNDFARAGVSRTFQNIRLFASQSVRENVEIAAIAHWPQTSQRSARDLADRLLAELGLADLADREAGTLDYGGQRRLEIARALALKPDFLLLDEPAAGMNPTESSGLFDTLSDLRRTYGFGLLVIDHDLKLIMRLCDRIVVLNKGQVIASGEPGEVQREPAVIEAYIGHKRAAVMARETPQG